MPHPSEHTEPAVPLGAAEAERLAELMRAFNAGSRVRLLFALVPGEQTVERLAELTGIEPGAVSQQLRVLRQLRFVLARRSGRNVFYSLYDHHVAELLGAIRHHGEHVVAGWAGGGHPSPEAVDERG